MYYAAGSMFQKGKDKEFGLVRPTGGLPYVWLADSTPRRTHTEHHSSLYSLGEDGKTLTLVKRGELCDDDPQTHVLSDDLAAQVSRVIKNDMYIAAD